MVLARSLGQSRAYVVVEKVAHEMEQRERARLGGPAALAPISWSAVVAAVTEFVHLLQVVVTRLASTVAKCVIMAREYVQAPQIRR